MLRLQLAQRQQARQFFGWLVSVWNKVDRNRITEVGADKACAEWLLRNGASVKWADGKGSADDYNALASISRAQQIQKIIADDASISVQGFEYLRHLERLEAMHLNKCNHIHDAAFTFLADNLKSRLLSLHVSNCPLVTSKGVEEMGRISSLQQLRLHDLAGIEGRDAWRQLHEHLQSRLPKCDISFSA